MSLVAMLWSMQAAAGLTLGVLYGVAWTTDRRNAANLTLCVVAVMMAVVARTEVGMMHATTSAEYVEWARLCQIPMFFALVGQMLFARQFLAAGRRWLLWTVVAMRVVVLICLAFVYPTVNWQSVGSLGHVRFLGEVVAVPHSLVISPLHWFPAISCVLAIVFVCDAALQAWHRGGEDDRRRAVVTLVGVALPLTMTVVYAQSVILGALAAPLLVTPSFLITIAVMTGELSRGVVLYRQTRRELEKLHMELAQSSRVTALGQLAAALAHELSQPLAAILRNTEAASVHLKNTQPDLVELREIMSDIHKDDRRAGAVIDQMRALIKRGTLQTIPLAVGDIVQGVVSLVRPDALARHVTVQYTPGPGLPLISGDRVHLSQVLLNLIINGMDAMQSVSDDERRIVITAHRAADHTVEIAVSDSGPGMLAEDIKRVFDPFFTTKPQGLGMGLPICRTIVEAHGGKLWAERGHGGHGLTFRFTLHQARAAAA